MKANPLQGNFNGGEFSPLLYGRVDIDRYNTGLARCLNYVPTIQGGLMRRPGTYYVHEVRNSANKSRLVRFEFSTEQAYILEFAGGYIRFYKDQGIIETAPDTPYEIACPYVTNHLFQLKFAQSADTLYITHPLYFPYKLTRTGHTAWTLAQVDIHDGPYLPTNTTTTTITPDGTSGTVTLTASTGIFTVDDLGRFIRLRHVVQNWTSGTAYAYGDYVQNDSGKVYLCIVAGTSAGSGGPTGVGQAIADNTATWQYESTDTARWGSARISVYTDTDEVDAVIETSGSLFRNFGAATATPEWRLGLWSDRTGYPGAVLFHEDRLMFSGPSSYPQRIDGSVVADYELFSPSDTDGTITDASALSFTLNSNTVNSIRWMASDEKGLTVGTVGEEWVVRPSDLGEALTPSNISAKPVDSNGSADISPVNSGKAALFVNRSGRKILEMRYFADDSGFRAYDLSQLAEHVTETGIVEIARQKAPQSLIWAVRNDGVLACMNYERDFDTLRVGWHRHTLGGDGVVESIAVIPSSDASTEEVWMIVKRTIDGSVVRYVEFMTPFFTDEDDLEDAFFVDCGLTYDGSATDTISGLDHLEGETVSILADGAVHPDVVVTSGEITLQYEVEKAQVGLPIIAQGQQLRLEAGSQAGTALGQIRRLNEVGMLLHRTLGLSVGMSFDKLDEITFRTSADESDGPPDLFSGVKIFTVDDSYSYEGQFCWEQTQPLPGTILAIMPRLVTNER